MNNQYDSISVALADLSKKGYNQNFSLRSTGLYCHQTSQTFKPEDLKIIEFHRFEGESNMDDMAILYVIESSTACKGVLIDAFGTYSDIELGDFLKTIPII
ncbi:MAG: phosphoribosylpyrophosphate synthetase [Flavobacteriaceae bacterium]|nr:phosphoribosylpyrophosphate synthetase [Flavobacteriaceae bacterium]